MIKSINPNEEGGAKKSTYRELIAAGVLVDLRNHPATKSFGDVPLACTRNVWRYLLSLETEKKITLDEEIQNLVLCILISLKVHDEKKEPGVRFYFETGFKDGKRHRFGVVLHPDDDGGFSILLMLEAELLKLSK
jgi:hypothetical protein